MDINKRLKGTFWVTEPNILLVDEINRRCFCVELLPDEPLTLKFQTSDFYFWQTFLEQRQADFTGVPEMQIDMMSLAERIDDYGKPKHWREQKRKRQELEEQMRMENSDNA